MKRILILGSSFSSAHKYENPNFTLAQNKKNFGRCFTAYGHGHNYKIEVGFVMEKSPNENQDEKVRLHLQHELKLLTQVLDHEHLNFVIPEFKDLVPTTENILLYFEKKISMLKLEFNLAFIKLFEADDLWSQKYYVTE